jgi:hypothetical protein
MNGLIKCGIYIYNIHIYIYEYYSAIKKNEIMLFAGKWMELEIIILHKLICQAEKDKGCMYSFLCGS